MNARAWLVRVVAVVASMVFSPAMASLAAQDDGGPADSAASAMDQPLPPVSELELQLLPLRQSDMKAVAEDWIGRLQALVAELSETELGAARALGAERTRLQVHAARLHTRRTAVVERVRAVLKSYKDKGGDTEEFEKYVSAVTEAHTHGTDAGALWIFVKTWLTSAEGGGRLLRSVLLFILTVFGFWILARVLARIVGRALKSFKMTSSLLREFLTGLVHKATMIVGAVVALSALGVNIGPLVAAIGAAGLVVGFALQGTLSNFASGIMILLYRPFDVGDGVTAGGVTGTVESMTLVSTTILTADNQRHVVPNNSVWSGVITNATGRPTRRIDLTFTISHGEDVDRARSVLEEIIAKHPLVLKDPAPLVQANELAPAGVNFVVRPWAKTVDYWPVYWDVVAEVKRRFDRAGLAAPVPRMDVRVLPEPK